MHDVQASSYYLFIYMSRRKAQWRQSLFQESKVIAYTGCLKHAAYQFLLCSSLNYLTLIQNAAGQLTE
jgi:hypothetical protein